MASIDINIGTSADAGNGDNLRAFATNVAAMFAEIYGLGTAESDLATGTAFRPALSLIANQAANTVIVRDANSSGTLSAKAVADTQLLIGDGTGFTAAALSGDVTMANTGAVTIANNAVEHAMLENRYTAINAIGSTSGAFDIDFSLGAIQTVTLGGAHTGTFINFKIGQVIDIIITGNYTLTFDATSSGTAAMRKVGSTDYDGTATQLIQVICASDDSTTPIFYYTVNTYATDTTP